MSDCIFRTAQPRHPERVAEQAHRPAGELRHLPAFSSTCARDVLEKITVFTDQGNMDADIRISIDRDVSFERQRLAVTLDAEATLALVQHLASRLGMVVCSPNSLGCPSEDGYSAEAEQDSRISHLERRVNEQAAGMGEIAKRWLAANR
jgi:hypothetical protein